MTFVKGHLPYPRNPNKPKVDKAQKMTDATVKAQVDKALQGDSRAFAELTKYYLNKGKIEAETEIKFNPDQFLKAFDEAVIERDRIIKETPLTCIVNKGENNVAS